MARQKKPFDAVQFTRESAERIAGVVRAAELAAPSASPLTFDRRFPERIPKMVRAATFLGAWPVGGTKVVTFKYAPTATQAVTNLSWPIAHNHTVAENCLVGKEGTSWWLVVPVLQGATGIFVTGTVAGSRVTDVNISASLNTSNCTISVGKTLTTASMTLVSTTATATYLRLRVP